MASDPKLPPLPDGSTNENPAGISLWGLLREDFATHGGTFGSQGFWVIAIHRFGNWRMGRSRVVRPFFSLLYKAFYPLTECLCGVKLSYNVRVGRRVKIEHFGGMVLGAREIGDDVTIRQNTTLGIARKAQLDGKPIIEDRVDIGCGVAILGPVRVGHDSVIGANAVVVKDVPPYSLVVGVPGHVVKSLAPPSESPSSTDAGIASRLAER